MLKETIYIPGYMALEKFEVEYNLDKGTMTVAGKEKPMSNYYKKRAEELQRRKQNG